MRWNGERTADPGQSPQPGYDLAPSCSEATHGIRPHSAMLRLDNAGRACRGVIASRLGGYCGVVIMDILIAIVIVAVAAVLGLVVHPVLWVIIIAAALWLFTRHSHW
ncbi:MAG: hypothetical protein J2P58_01135 [Acidimicrobiaceae bacterium]|nr:hypothetical protein [Acidimicrobiaceae bacterium]MBO0748124.1 hypothetical protein [Acidimicrobiaceae bacterium]